MTFPRCTLVMEISGEPQLKLIAGGPGMRSKDVVELLASAAAELFRADTGLPREAGGPLLPIAPEALRPLAVALAQTGRDLESARRHLETLCAEHLCSDAREPAHTPSPLAQPDGDASLSSPQ